MRKLIYKIFGIEKIIRAEAVGFSSYLDSCNLYGYPRKENGNMMDVWELWDYYADKSGKRESCRKYGAYRSRGFAPVDSRNFIEEALMKGFRPHDGKDFNPGDGWFGCNVLFQDGKSPERILVRGNKKIILSLQGVSMPMPPAKEKELWVLLNEGECKYLCFIKGKRKIYETWSGKLPDRKLIDRFIK